MLNFERIPKILKLQRKYEGLTQKDVADELGIPYQDYQKYEYGKVIPSKERFRDLSNILNMPITNEFYHLTDEKQTRDFSADLKANYGNIPYFGTIR